MQTITGYPAHWLNEGGTFGTLIPGKSPKLKPEVKSAWLAELRDPHNHQAKRALKIKLYRPSGHPAMGAARCCLGVLSDLSLEMGAGIYERCELPDEWSSSPRYTYYTKDNVPSTEGHFYAGRAWDGMPPSTLFEWAGINDEVGRYLAQANDAGYSFAQIADWIEAEL